MRRRGTEERIGEQEGAADHRVADQHAAEAEGADDRGDDQLVGHRPGGAGKGDEARVERVEAEPDLQHQRQQERQRAEPDAEDEAADRRHRVGRDAHQREVDDRMIDPPGMAHIERYAHRADREDRHHHRQRKRAAADQSRSRRRGSPARHPVSAKPRQIERPHRALAEVLDEEAHQQRRPSRPIGMLMKKIQRHEP